jgi:hypothetical protein
MCPRQDDTLQHQGEFQTLALEKKSTTRMLKKPAREHVFQMLRVKEK